MQPPIRAWWAVAVLATAGVVLAVLGEPAPAVALAAGALALPAVIRNRAIDEDIAVASTQGPQRTLATLVDALGLEGHGIFLPPTEGEARVRVLLPARDLAPEEAPPAEPGTVLQRGRAGVAGAVLPHPGQGLEDLWASQSALPEGGGLEAATAQLRRALPALGLGDKVHAGRRGGIMSVSFRPLTMEPVCRDAATTSRPWSVQGGCPTVAFVTALVTRALARPVRVQEVRRDEGGVQVDLVSA